MVLGDLRIGCGTIQVGERTYVEDPKCTICTKTQV